MTLPDVRQPASQGYVICNADRQIVIICDFFLECHPVSWSDEYPCENQICAVIFYLFPVLLNLKDLMD